MALLQVRNLSKSFAGVVALKDVQLDVEAGCVHALMGENGAGKSTLMKILVGLLSPDAGRIEFEGNPVRIRNPRDALRLGIAMIHQELMPFKNLTVAENISMGREPARWFPGWIDREAMSNEADVLLRRLGMPVASSRKMSSLSVAQTQIVEIAKALARNAKVVIMDEPTSAISGREVETLFAVIRELKQRGVAVIYISHKMDEVFRVADAITVLRDGCHISTQPASELDAKKLIALMVGRELARPADECARAGEPVLEVQGLSKPGRFQNIDFTLHRGEVLGLAGLMGAGRTDVAHAIYGLAPPASGKIKVRGRDIRIANPSDAIASGIALVSEDRKELGLVSIMSVKHNLTLSSIPNWRIHRQAEDQIAGEQVRTFGIKVSNLRQPVASLSGGNQQKVVIAKALLRDPDVVILDEPTRGIDIGAKCEIYAIIKRLAAAGKAILLISSELPELLTLSHRLLVMRQGVVSAELHPLRTTQEEILKFSMPEVCA